MTVESGTAKGRQGVVRRVAGRARVVISGVEPEVDCGRYPVKRVVGDDVVVEADVFADGHDLVAAVVLHRHVAEGEGDRGEVGGGGGGAWIQSPMEPLGNDRFRGRFGVKSIGRYEYAVAAWIDRFGTWLRDLGKRIDAGQELGVDLLIGAQLLEDGAERAARGGMMVMRRSCGGRRGRCGRGKRTRRWRRRSTC